MALSTIYIYLTYTSVFFALLSLFIAIYKKTYKDATLLPIFWLMLIYLLVAGWDVFSSKTGVKGHMLFRGCSFAEITCFSLFYYKLLRPRKWKNMISLGYNIYCFIGLWDYYERYNANMEQKSVLLVAALLILYSLITFLYFNNRTFDRSIMALPEFWINTAVLLYFTGSMMVYIFNGYLKAYPDDIITYLWNAALISHIIYNMLLSIGLWKNFRG